jgi:uncharacterized protein (TIGR04255 family)
VENTKLPKYRKPPVVEVIIGISFASIEKLATVDYGSFWESVKEEYPLTEDNAPLPEEVSAGPQVQLMQIPPLRRVFLIHRDQTYLMQLQPDRFIHNWRKLKESDDYPNFENAKGKFVSGWKLFRDFIAARQLGPIRLRGYEVTYINHFIEAPQTFPLGTARYLPLFEWSSGQSEGFLPPPNVLGLDLRFPLAKDKGTLRVSVKHGKRVSDNKDVMLAQLTAQGPASSDGSDMEEWIETAHEWIVRGFTDLTSRDAHQKWERFQ